MATGLQVRDASVPGGSKLRQAVSYNINQRAPLTAFPQDGMLPIHNNDAERDLRHIAVGRKN